MQKTGEWTHFEGIEIELVALLPPATNTSDVDLIRKDEDETCSQLQSITRPIIVTGSAVYAKVQSSL